MKNPKKGQLVLLKVFYLCTLKGYSVSGFGNIFLGFGFRSIFCGLADQDLLSDAKSKALYDIQDVQIAATL